MLRPAAIILFAITCSAQLLPRVWTAGPFGMDIGWASNSGLHFIDDGVEPAVYFDVFNEVFRWDGLHSERVAREGQIGSMHSIVRLNIGAGPAIYVGADRGLYQLTSDALIEIDTDMGFIEAWAQIETVDGTETFVVSPEGVDLRRGDAWEAVGRLSRYDYGKTLKVWDDGSGPHLYVGGRFESVTPPGPDVAIHSIGRFRNGTWEPVGDGLMGSYNGYGASVRSMAIFDDGSGEALYVAGDFQQAGELPVGGIARWNGIRWTAVGNAAVLDGWVEQVRVIDDGAGPALYAVGSFRDFAGVEANGIARWDGTSWSTLGGGIGPPPGIVTSIVAMDEPSGRAVYVTGYFELDGWLRAIAAARFGATCPDVDGDGAVDIRDLLLLLIEYGGPTGLHDPDNDGDVDFRDLTLLLASIGAICP